MGVIVFCILLVVFCFCVFCVVVFLFLFSLFRLCFWLFVDFGFDDFVM